MAPSVELANAPSRIRSRYRLGSGYHLFPSNESWYLLRPDGLLARMTLRGRLGEALAEALRGIEPTEIAERSEVDPEELLTLLDNLVGQGIATIAEEAAESIEVDGEATRTRTSVAIEGEGPIASLLIRTLSEGGLDAVAIPPGAEGEVADPSILPDILVSTADWLPDRLFAQRDTWCRRHGVAWHGVYQEGHSFYLGPFWLPDDPRTVPYADARARRLAAGSEPEAMEAYWHYLETSPGVTPAEPPSPAEAALVAGALAADILAWSAQRTPPSHGHQLAYDRASGEWRRHPVLPVPRGLMTEAIP